MSEPSSLPSGPIAFLRRHVVKLVTSCVIAVAFWLILHGGGLPVLPDAEVLGHVRWWTVGAYAASVMAWSLVRALRSRHMLRLVANVSLREILVVSWIGFVAIFVLPFRLGELVRPGLLHARGSVPFSTATGAFGAERIIDGLFLMVVLGIALPLGGPVDPLPDHIGKLPIPVAAVPAAAYTMLTVFVCAFAAMALFYWRRDFARQLTVKVVGLVSGKLASFLADQVEKLSSGFAFLPSPRHLAAYLIETALYWGLAGGGMWLLAWGCGVEQMTLVRAFALMGVLGMGIIVPGAPGYFGAFQASVYAGLALYVDEPVVLGAGAAFVFLLYAVQLSMMFVNALVGLMVGAGQKAPRTVLGAAG